MNKTYARVLALVTLILFFGLQAYRTFLPHMIWYLGGKFPAEQLALIALGIFALSLFAPLLRRLFGERGMLVLTAGGLMLVYLCLWLARSAFAFLSLSAFGLALWGWFIPSWQMSPRNRPQAESLPVSVLAFPLAFLLDGGVRSLLWGYDLVYLHDWGYGLIVVVFVAIAARLLWCALRIPSTESKPQEAGFSITWSLVGLGPFLYLAMAYLQNPAAFSTASSLSDAAAHMLVTAFGALGALACLFQAFIPTRYRGLSAILSGLTLVATLSLLFVHFGSAWGAAWVFWGLAVISMWLLLGWLLGGTACPKRKYPGLWRSALATFLALLVMLVVVFLVAQYEVYASSIAAGLILAVAGISSARFTKQLSRQNLRLPLRLLSATAGLVYLAVCARFSFSLAPEPLIMLDGSRPLRVMTYNIHQGVDADLKMDLEAIAAAINTQSPDVLALNEVNRARATNGFTDTLLYLCRRLGMPYVFGANYADGQYGNAILSRFPILSWKNIHYQAKTTEVRGLLRVVVETDAGPITFYATHLDHIGGSNNVRAAQVAEALAVWKNQERAVLLGDLNAEPDKPELSALYQVGLIDLLAAGNLDNAFTFWDPVPTPGRRIDYIFITSDLTFGQIWVPQTRASDHLPVLAEIGP